MRLFRSRTRTCALAVLLLFTPVGFAQTAGAPSHPEIAFKVSMSRPFTHLLEVEMRLSNQRGLGARTSVAMPVWTPGSYLIREYARHVQDFAATNGAGQPLAWTKTNKNTWRIETRGTREAVITYKVYANELTVRSNELNERHAFFTPAALLMYPEGHLNTPSTIHVVPFGDWQVATGLPQTDGQQNTFRAENFDVLYDSPFEAGPFRTISFDVRGVPHRIVIEGEGNYDAGVMRADVKRIVEAAVELMGDVPYRDYTFILNLVSSGGGGGLEHLNSTALMANRFGLRPGTSAYTDFLNLVAHEFFHLWNVKRIRPDTLGPFDYGNENYTRSLWVAEGFTSYYANLLLRRAGLITEQQFLTDLSNTVAGFQRLPGRKQMSAEEASFDSWIKYYRRDENDVNSQISYYDKGELLGFMLDLEIRGRTGNAKSLDDVMRYLYTEFSGMNRNFSPADFQKACELMAGASLESFFQRFVRGRDELDYNSALAHAGLRLELPSGSPLPFFGADLAQSGDRLMVLKVYAETPAYEQGLNYGDQIVAVNGARATLSFFNDRIAEMKPGDTIRLAIFRKDELTQMEFKLGSRQGGATRITRIETATDSERSVYAGWIGGAR